MSESDRWIATTPPSPGANVNITAWENPSLVAFLASQFEISLSIMITDDYHCLGLVNAYQQSKINILCTLSFLEFARAR